MLNFFLCAWLVPAIVILVLGLCMAHIKYLKTGVFPRKFFIETFLAMVVWPIPLVLFVGAVIFVNDETLKKIFKLIDL